MREMIVPRQRWWIGAVAVTLVLAAPHKSAQAQGTDYTAGKTPAQLFSSTCSACHQTPRGLAKTNDQRALTGFLREHYTTKVEAAGALANYLIGIPGGPEPRGRQSTARGTNANPPRPAAGVDGLEDTERSEAENKQKSAARDAAKAAEAKARAAKRKKVSPAEAAHEAAKAAEEAEKAKIHEYATAGQRATPREVAAPTPATGSAAPAQTQDGAAASPSVVTAPADSPPAGEPSAASAPERPTIAVPAPESPSGGGTGEHPAQTPPG